MMCNAYLSKIQKRQRDRHTKTSNIAPNYLEFDCDCANNREHKFLRVNVMSQSDFSVKLNLASIYLLKVNKRNSRTMCEIVNQVLR